MASKLSSAEGVCEGDDCEANADVSYRVKKKRKKVSNVGDQDIDDAIMENKAKLNILKKKVMEKLKLYRVYGKHIGESRHAAEKHLQSIKDEVDSVIEEAIAKHKIREQKNGIKIDEEINDENETLEEEIRKMQHKIRNNNGERKNRHRENKTNAEKRQEPLTKKQCALHADIESIDKEIKRKFDEMEKSWEDDTKSTENANQKLDTVLKDDQHIVKDGHHVNISVSNELKKPLNEGEVKEINRVVSGVRFVKGAGKGMMYDGRIDGYDGEWKLIDTINATSKFTLLAIVGCIDECNTLVTEQRGSMLTYMLDLNTKNRERVIHESNTLQVRSCEALIDGKVVCGKETRSGGYDTREGLTGCISVYDRQWELINEVTIPKTRLNRVDVVADQDGMIIAAEPDQSKIYVINPADGKIINTITCKENIRLRDMLSSGHIIAQPWHVDRRALIIDREGAQREIPHNDVIRNVCVDHKTDDLYVVTSDDECKTCVIDLVMSEGEMKKRRVASFPLSTRKVKGHDMGDHLIFSRVMITSSGKMIACDGDNILVFRKLFSL